METHAPPFHRNAPETSMKAAGSIANTAETLRARVMAHLAEKGDRGATDEEMQVSLEMPANTQRPRRWELEKSGRVKDSGQRRKTVSGRMAVVWVEAKR